MPNGILGPMTEPGKFEDSDISGAKDASEAYDLRQRDIVCTIGSLSIVGPRGFVSRFTADDLTDQRIEFGTATVSRVKSRICVVIPKTLVTTKTGTREIFSWSDYCCSAFGIEGDCAVGLKFIRQEKATQEERSLLRPLVVCTTDVQGAITDGIVDLVKAGLSSDQAKALLGTVFKADDSAKGAQRSLDAITIPVTEPIPREPVREQIPRLQVSAARGLQSRLLNPAGESV